MSNAGILLLKIGALSKNSIADAKNTLGSELEVGIKSLLDHLPWVNFK
jgi:hypothetical protein